MNLIKKAVKSLFKEGLFQTYYKFKLHYYRKKSGEEVFQFDQLIYKYQWDEAITLGQKLIKKYPRYFYIYRRLALCYYRKDQRELSKITMQRALELKLNMHINKIVKRINKSTLFEGLLVSEFVYLGGHQNIGFIIQKQQTGNGLKEYITKICEKDVFKKELQLYTEIVERFPMIKSITPKVYSVNEINDLSFITMDKINGNKPGVDNLEKIIELDFKITSIKYRDVADWFGAPKENKGLIFPGKNIMLTLDFLIYIHLESANQDIFKGVIKRINRLQYSQQTIDLITRMEKIILGNRLYEQLDISEHYSLQHGDFREYNMRIESDGNIYLYDWGRMMVGPKWLGMAGYLWDKQIPFGIILKTYLSGRFAKHHLQPIEKLFFVYVLVLGWFLFMEKHEFENNPDINRAVAYIEEQMHEIHEIIVFQNEGIPV